MRRTGGRAGMTLVEVLLAVVLVSVAATLVYSGGFHSYKILMRSRLRLEAQGIAFDRLWQTFNLPLSEIQRLAEEGAVLESTPEGGVFPTNGTVRVAVMPETNAPISTVEYWEIVVQVWAPSNDVLFAVMNDDGTVDAAYSYPLAEYTVFRYPGER